MRSQDRVARQKPAQKTFSEQKRAPEPPFPPRPLPVGVKHPWAVHEKVVHERPPFDSSIHDQTATQRANARSRALLLIFLLVSFWLHLALVGLLVYFEHGSAPVQRDLRKPTRVTLLSKDPEHPFMPTDNQDEAPHQAYIESDHDTRKKTLSQQARDQASSAPELEGKKDLTAQLDDRPFSPNRPQPQGAEDQKQPQSAPETAQAEPTKTEQPQAASEQPHTTPDGLPILAPIDAPTLAQRDPSRIQTKQVSHKSVELPYSFAAAKSDIEGSTADLGQTSVDAMESEIGRYKARIYQAVGSRWYSKLQDPLTLQAIPVGTVHIRFTIHDDGTVDWEVLSGDTPDLQLLRSISENAIRESAPYPPFSQKLREELGDHYTDDFSFSVY